MSFTRAVVTGFVLAAIAVGAGCSSSSPMSRIDSDRALYESWPLDTQQAVFEGRVLKGMTKEQVEMSVGKPSEKSAQQARKGLEEVWTYKPRGGGMGNTSVSLGGVLGGVGVGGTPIGGGGGGGNTDETNEVVFVDGVVVRSTFPQ
jgi:hypothetical protein